MQASRVVGIDLRVGSLSNREGTPEVFRGHTRNMEATLKESVGQIIRLRSY